MKQFWLKELINQPLYTKGGAKVPFEDIGGTYGLFASENDALNAELAVAVKNHVGGVIPLTEAEYNSWAEKKRSYQSSLDSSPQSRERESLGPIPFQQLQAIRAAGAAAVASPIAPGPNLISSPNQAQQQAGQQRVEPLSIPQSFSKPRVGKIPKSAPSPPAPSAPPPA
jgi:hypothetical protein